MSWAVIHLGSREHYAVPAALHREGKLSALLADTWVSSLAARTLRPFAPALAARRSDAIPDHLVKAANAGRFMYEMKVRVGKLDTWQACMLRIGWFGRWSAKQLEKVRAETVFSYSYNAQWPFEVARRKGMRRVLDLIDGGWIDEKLVERMIAPYVELAPVQERAPDAYWSGLKTEIELADIIVVNSVWSKNLWIEAGIPASKLVEIPLVYQPMQAIDRPHSYPANPDSRLQALFLGSVRLRKGVGHLFDAIRLLQNEPIDFTFAGPVGVKIPEDIISDCNVRFLGPVDRATTEVLYSKADVFLFPTLSDGFGLTQLEALSHGVPVIASTHCARLVEHGLNGLLLDAVDPKSIADSLIQLVRNRNLLVDLKRNAKVPRQCEPDTLAPALARLEAQS